MPGRAPRSPRSRIFPILCRSQLERSDTRKLRLGEWGGLPNSSRCDSGQGIPPHLKLDHPIAALIFRGRLPAEKIPGPCDDISRLDPRLPFPA